MHISLPSTHHLDSTKEQGYTVSDCTGEGLKAVMYLQHDLEYASLCILFLNLATKFIIQLHTQTCIRAQNVRRYRRNADLAKPERRIRKLRAHTGSLLDGNPQPCRSLR